MILLVLIQRGRGGGLSGAFGGMGGQSAFGAKAGDTFTHITISAAGFWIVLCLVGVKWMGSEAIASKFTEPGVMGEEIPGETSAPLATSDGTTGEGTTGEGDAPAPPADGPALPPAADSSGDPSESN
ncbi:MAG: preprotein translocase subunit SecG [Planctomycetota bacterium]